MTTSARPELTAALSAETFRDFYWLKAELAAFCRAHGLSTGGSKTEITERVAVFLSSGERVAPTSAGARRTPPMPTLFARETVIGAGWRCSEPLRAFFRQELGERFRFDGVMRDFIRDGEGKTLEEMITAWSRPREKTAIAPQFEYNRHMREFFEQHPDATRGAALEAWRQKRARPRP